jgi:rhodanese-related sulfurtransferase
LKEYIEMYSEDFASLVHECIQLHPDASWITIEEFQSKENRGDWVIVDARDFEEREVSIIPSAIGIEEFIENKEDFKKTPILFYCTIGCRSGLWAEELKADGFEAYNLWGGVLAWALSRHPLVTPEGETTKRVHVYGEKWALLPNGFDCVW